MNRKKNTYEFRIVFLVVPVDTNMKIHQCHPDKLRHPSTVVVNIRLHLFDNLVQRILVHTGNETIPVQIHMYHHCDTVDLGIDRMVPNKMVLPIHLYNDIVHFHHLPPMILYTIRHLDIDLASIV